MAKVTIYSTSTCPWCAKAKEFLKAHKIKFTDKDVGENRKYAEEMVKKSKQMGVPIIDIDGKITVGYDEDRLKKLLKIK